MDEDEDYEPTAMLGMMSEFQKQFGMASNHATSTKDKSTNLSVFSTGRKPEDSFMQHSLVASFMEQEENLSLLGKSKKDSSMMKSQQKLNLTKPNLDLSKPNLDFTKPGLDVSKPSLNITNGIKPGLDMTKPNLDVTKPGLDFSKPNLDLSKITIDISKAVTPPPAFEPTETLNLELTRTTQNQLTDVELGIGNLSMREDLDPFDTEIHSKLLRMIPEPVESRHGFVSLRGQNLPSFKPNSNVMIGDNEFYCMECKGEGGYGKVFKVR